MTNNLLLRFMYCTYLFYMNQLYVHTTTILDSNKKMLDTTGTNYTRDPT